MRLPRLLLLAVAAAAIAIFLISVRRPAPSSGLHWFPHDEGLALAAKEGRLALIVCSSRFCPACRKYMEILEDREVAAFIEEHFVPILVKDDPLLFAKYNIEYVPTTIVLDPRIGEIISMRVGCLPKHELLSWLRECLGKVKG